MNSTTIAPHASHVASKPRFIPGRFDALRRDRMMVGSALCYVRTLARIDRLADRVEEVERQVGLAIEAMNRIGLAAIEAEAEAEARPRDFLDGIDADFEISEPLGQGDEWPAFPSWCDDERWTTEPTPIELLLPPVSGGAPEAYQPTSGDLREYETWSAEFNAKLDAINGGIELDSSHFSEDDARAAGLAV